MNELLSRQSRCIAHEIRNHLSICELYSQVIKKNLEKDGINNPSVENALECINKSLKIMGNSLLDLKSLNNISPAKCDIKEVLEEGVRLSAVYTSGRDIKIICDIKESAPVYIDQNKFLACIVNIIKNATEAIEDKGEIKVSLEIRNENEILHIEPVPLVKGRQSGDLGQSAKFVVIKISNNGKPISKDKQDEIFKEGFTTKATGSGLGLHICATNLKAQNAQLKLTRSTQEITEFEITLPIV